MADMLDTLIKRRRRSAMAGTKAGKMMDDEEARGFAKGAAKRFFKGRFTASQTGAKQLARERRGVSVGSYAAETEKHRLPKGATPQFRTTSQEDIESMINPGRKRKGGY